MKSLKAAAVVAGSVVVAGAAAPAFAADASNLTPSSLNGALETVTSQRTLNAEDLMPLQHRSNALDTENKGSLLNSVDGVTEAVNSSGTPAKLLGGLPLQS
ncbi:hypothetical protein BKI49_12890 [Streptomyces sp. Tue6028]|uniref:hypothetical protein n=1 Tax=Streptomyces sp. Tue6028 TaxID=2036037 RepID=UPI000BB3C577|nr:hypothetical protein [Streptomyces sp. Tue6028]PBC63664.1 hypothetical protein BKI49_12890 [Streptomyces sp. Tue6028]